MEPVISDRALRAKLEDLQSRLGEARRADDTAVRAKLEAALAEKVRIEAALPAMDGEISDLERSVAEARAEHAEQLEQANGLLARVRERKDPSYRDWYPRQARPRFSGPGASWAAAVGVVLFVAYVVFRCL